MRNNFVRIAMLIFLSILVLGSNVCAEAKVRHVFDNNNFNTEFNVIHGNETAVNCNGIFTSDALDLVSDVLNWIRILAPCLLLVLIGVDFGSAVLQQDNDILKKATGKIVKRCIATALLFLVPTIVRILLNLKGVRDTLEIPNDPLCGTMNNIVEKNNNLLK